MSVSDSIQIEHFSDVLCIWAYVGQIRIDELKQQFADRVTLTWRYVNVFGDTAYKFAGWQDRGGRAGYRRHVEAVAEGFDHVSLHPGAWTDAVPASSLPVHLLLRAIALYEASAGQTELQERAAWQLRQRFFADGRDIADRDEQAAVLAELSIPVEEVFRYINDGLAYAALAEDLRMTEVENVTGSPTLVFNDGRQHIYGNVGYRVIEANLRELLERPADQCSWC